MRSRCLPIATTVAALLAVSPACAQAIDGLRLGGYGTVGFVQDNRNDIAPLRDISQRPDDNYGRGSWQRDSRLGIQAEYRINPRLDLVGQAVFRDQVSRDASHAIELAYAGFKPTSQLDVRVGRVGYDAFLMSDTRNVGYAYPWVRPFTEYYGWIPLFSIDGADVAYAFPHGSAQWRLKAQFGHSHTGIPIGDAQLDFKTRNMLSLTASRRSGPWEAKLGFSSFTSHNEVSPGGPGGGLATLQQGLDAIAAATSGLAPPISGEAADLRQQLSFRGARVQYLTMGAAYNNGTWLAQAELAKTVATHDLVPHGTMGYAVVGYQRGDWLPFIAISATRPGNNLRKPANDWSLIGQASAQAMAISALNSSRMDQTTFTLGTRWDFNSHAALKLQWDHTRISPNGYGLLFKDPALENQSSRMNQLSVMLNFLF